MCVERVDETARIHHCIAGECASTNRRARDNNSHADPVRKQSVSRGGRIDLVRRRPTTHVSSAPPSKKCLGPGLQCDEGLVFGGWLITKWDDPVRLSARRIDPQYCSREFALDIRLREPR